MNKEDLPYLESAAYHEAGHAVMAIEKGIAVHRLAIHRRRPRGRSQFASAGATLGGSLIEYSQIRDAADRRLMFRLAGPAAELIRLEKHHRIGPFDPARKSFRCLWLRRRWAERSADFDTAYALALAWTFAQTPDAVRRHVEMRFEQIREAFSYGAMWRQIERLAGRLAQRRKLSGNEVLRILDVGSE